MSSVVISGDSSGTVTLTVPSAAGTNTATLPAATGTVMVSGNMPAFSAYQSGGQSIASNTFTKLQFQTKEFDTANCFDATTNYRFTPTVAGYYQVSGGAGYALTTQAVLVAIFKNGSEFKRGNYSQGANTIASALIYMNGSTDYVELYTYQNSAGAINSQAGVSGTFFQAALVRAA